MSKARAAQIWAQLERQLIEHCGLPNGGMLDRARSQLIRTIGKALSGRAAVPPPLPVPVPDQARLVVNKSRPGETSRQAVYPSDTIHDPAWAAMLERSCSRRMGYDGDDEVTHAGSR